MKIKYLFLYSRQRPGQSTGWPFTKTCHCARTFWMITCGRDYMQTERNVVNTARCFFQIWRIVVRTVVFLLHDRKQTFIMFKICKLLFIVEMSSLIRFIVQRSCVKCWVITLQVHRVHLCLIYTAREESVWLTNGYLRDRVMDPGWNGDRLRCGGTITFALMPSNRSVSLWNGGRKRGHQWARLQLYNGHLV